MIMTTAASELCPEQTNLVWCHVLKVAGQVGGSFRPIQTMAGFFLSIPRIDQFILLLPE